MKNVLFILSLFFILSCENDSKVLSVKNCLNVEDFKLLEEGVVVFEEMLANNYYSNSLKLKYDDYFKDLMIASNKIDSLFKFKKALSFIEKLEKKDKLKVFWQINDISSDFKSEAEMMLEESGSLKNKSKIYYINSTEYLRCLQKASKTTAFKKLFERLKKSNELSHAVAVSSFLEPENITTIEKDKEIFRVFIAFHVYYEMMLNSKIINE